MRPPSNDRSGPISPEIMPRRITLTVAVAVLLTLSGCSALPVWDDGGATPTPEGETPTETADGVPTADPGGESGDAPDVAYPDGYGPNGIEAPDDAISNHVGSLVASDGYIFTYDALIREGDAESTIGIVNQADNVDQVGYQIQNRPNAAVVGYYEDDRVYVREEQGGEVRYNASQFNYSMSRFTGFQYLGPLLAQAEYGDAEVIETDAGTFYHYVSEDVYGPSQILRTDVDEDRIDRFDVAIVVDDDGVIRHANFVVEADRNITVTMGVSEIGSTNVERPQWFDEAADS